MMLLLTYFSVYLVTMVLFAIVGMLLLKLLGVKWNILQAESLFWSTFLGLLICVMGFSLLKAHGKTIHLSLLLLGGFLWFELRKGQNQALTWPHNKLSYVKLVSFMIGAIGITYLYQAASVYTGHGLGFIAQNGFDYTFYAMIAQQLGITGVESWFVPDVAIGAAGTSLVPYHYFDLWLTALIQQCTGLNHFLVYQLVCQSIFITLGLLGILALFQRKGLVQWWALAMIPILFLFGYYHFYFYNKFSYLSYELYRLNHFGENVLGMPKLLQLVPFAAASILFFDRKNYLPGFICILALPMIYIATLPAVFGTLWLLFCINWLYRLWTKQENWRFLLYTFLTLLFYALFYWFFGEAAGAFNLKALRLFDMAALATRRNIIILSSLQTVALYLPFLLIVIALIVANKLYQQLKHSLFFFGMLAVAVFFTGLSAWALMFEDKDGMQLLGNGLVISNWAFMYILVLVLAALAQQGLFSLGSLRKIFNLGLVAVMLVLLAHKGYKFNADNQQFKATLSQQYSTAYLQQIGSAFQKEKHVSGGFLKGWAEYNDPKEAPMHRISLSAKLGWYLVLLPQYLSTSPLSVYDIPFNDLPPIEQRRQMDAWNKSPFYRFVEAQKAAGSFRTLEESQLDFIRQYGLKFVIASATAKISPLLQQATEQEFVDKNSGERFLVLKK
ncbi:MAG: hypothetical protein SFW35_13945 [Chitinophagales bacterium]|nr:hypothetical protein [Chitinophagales bacterium]